MDRLAIECICTFGMPPVEYVELASELRVSRIGVGRRERLVPCVAAARKLLAGADQAYSQPAGDMAS